MFAEEHQLPGQLESRFSLASCTSQFIRRTYLGESLTDTVQVTANPHGLKAENGCYGSDPIFYKTISALDRWDETLQTIPPEDMVELTLEAHRQHPHKRLIAHFVQPHTPYIGPKADEIHSAIGKPVAGWNLHRDWIDRDFDDVESSPLSVAEEPESPIEAIDIRDAYRESLQITLEAVETLLDELGGKTVITADHGELLGERVVPGGRPFWGHPGWLKTNALRRVPWFVHVNGPRRSIDAGEPTAGANEDPALIDQRLRALGYA